MIKKTPLYDRHLALGAKISPFGGYQMPVQYAGINAEHRAVRSAAGLFDVSHMGEFRVKGADALTYLNNVTLNDVSALEIGQAHYSAMCYEDGGIVDDLLIYKRNDHYMLVVNAANIEKDFDWLRSHLKGSVSLDDMSEDIGLIAIQGPASRDILSAVLDEDLSGIEFYHFTERKAHRKKIIISRTGYTGELGFEIYTDPSTTVKMWDDLMTAGEPKGMVPAGLGARDTLRLEMKYCLYGNDITLLTNPIEAGLGWITNLHKGPFIGSNALTRIKEEGPTRRLVTFEMQERAIPRHGYPILVDGAVMGEVTSGTQSPTLGKGIGMGYIRRPHTKFGTEIEIEIRGKGTKAVVVKPPFVKDTSLMA